jgi:hypothetical protein
MMACTCRNQLINGFDWRKSRPQTPKSSLLKHLTVTSARAIVSDENTSR